jgi:hypothetical protein
MKKIVNRAISLLLVAVLVLTLLPAFALPVAAADTAGNAMINGQPADSTYSREAPARFSVSAMSPDGGNLTYAWYRSIAYDNIITDANGGGKNAIVATKNQVNGGAPLGTASVLLTDTPAVAGKYYYYWCEVTNHKGGTDQTTPTISNLALVKLVDRKLPTALVNGDMSGPWGPSYQAQTANLFLSESFGPNEDGWSTTHVLYRVANGNVVDGVVVGDYVSQTGVIEVGVSYNYWGSGAPYTGRGKIVELGANEASSLYQDIATVPGKIYEWSMDHSGINNITAQSVAVVIGKAINEQSDYGSGVTDRWADRYITTASNVDVTRPANTVAGNYGGANGYPYGVDELSYFNDIVKALANRINGNSDDDTSTLLGSYTQEYNGSTYYVFVTNPVKNAWNTYSGVYTVPQGQGTTVFGFVYTTPAGRQSNGNLLDNIVFASGSDIEPAPDLEYTGETEIEIETKAGYAYALLELRGSSLNTINGLAANTTYTPQGGSAGAVTIATSGWLLGSTNSLASGTLLFSNLTPGKSYRVIGIPEAAINTELHTNETPSNVFDEGYYYDTKIKPIFGGDDETLSGISLRVEGSDIVMSLENTNVNTQYALLTSNLPGTAPTAIPAIPGEYGTGTEWTPGGQTVIVWHGLAPSTTYWLVARPLGWDEVDYASAAYDNGLLAAQKVRTPGVSSATEIDKVYVTRAAGGASITVTGTLAAQLYAIADISTGAILTAKTVNGGGAVTFSGLEPSRIYQVVTRTDEADSIWLEGVRVYPYAEALVIDYAAEAVKLSGSGTGYTGYIPTGISYRFGSGDLTAGTGAAYIGLSETQIASGDRLYYRLTATSYTGQSVYPEIDLTIPVRPDAPSVLKGNFSFDFAAETLVAGAAIQYRSGNTVYNVAKDVAVPFTTLGWTGASAVNLDLRLPAVAGLKFASQYTSVPDGTGAVIPARPIAPGVIAVVPSGTIVNLNRLDTGRVYEWYKNSAGWANKTVFIADSSSKQIDLLYSDTPGDTYTVRFAATSTEPSSYPVTVAPEPLLVTGVNFGTYIYGTAIGSQYFMLSNTTNDTDITIAPDAVVVDGAFQLNYNGGTKVPMSDYKSDVYSITPNAGLNAGTYEGEITVTYTIGLKTYTAKAKVYLTVDKAQWNMDTVEANVQSWPPEGFNIYTYGKPDGATLKYRLGLDGAWTDATSGNLKSYSGLHAATSYTVYVKAEDTPPAQNHYDSAPKELITVHTIHATPTASNVVEINYENETLLFKSGNNPADYEVTINGTVVTHGSSVTSFAEADELNIIVKHKASGLNGMYGESLPSPVWVVDGKADAPADVTTHYATDASTADGQIIWNSAFKFTPNGGSWAAAQNSVGSGAQFTASVTPGTWLVRVPATATAFASKAAAVIVDDFSKLEDTVDDTYSNVTFEGRQNNDSGAILYSFTRRVKRNEQLVVPTGDLPIVEPEWRLITGQSAKLTLTPTNENVTVKLHYEVGVASVTIHSYLFTTAATTTPVIADIVIPKVVLGSQFRYLSPSIPGYQRVDGTGANVNPSDGIIDSVAANASLTFYYKPSEGNQTVIYWDNDAGAEIGRTSVTVRVNTSETIAFPDITNYTKVTADAVTRTWDGAAEPADITYYYTRNKAAVTLKAYNSSTNAEITSTAITTAGALGNQRVGELFDISAGLTALDTAVGLTDYTRLNVSSNLYVDATTASNNVVSVYYKPKTPAAVTVNIKVSVSGALLQSYEIPSAINEVVTLDPDTITIAGYVYDSGNSGNKLSVTVDGTQPNDTITMFMTDNRKTVAVTTVVGTSETATTTTAKYADTTGIVVYPPYVPGYTVTGYKVWKTASSEPVWTTVAGDATAAVSVTLPDSDNYSVKFQYTLLKTVVDSNYVTVTVEGHQTSATGTELYRYTIRAENGLQLTVIPFNVGTEWVAPSSQTITPTANTTITFVYTYGVADVTIKAQLFGTNAELITPVIKQKEPLGTRAYAPLPVPGYTVVSDSGTLPAGANKDLTVTLSGPNTVTYYYLPSTGNQRIVLKENDTNGAVIGYVTQMVNIGVNETIAIPATPPPSYTLIAGQNAVQRIWDGTAAPTDVEYFYTRETVTVTLRAVNAGVGASLTSFYTINARANEVLSASALANALAALDDEVSDEVTGATSRVSGISSLYIGDAPFSVDVPYNVVQAGDMLINVKDNAGTHPLLFSYIIHSAVGQTVTVDTGSINYAGYAVVPGTYTKVVNNDTSLNFIDVFMTDLRKTVTVKDNGGSTLSKTEYVSTSGLFVPVPYKVGYVADGYEIATGTPTGTYTDLAAAGVTLPSVNDNYTVVFRYITLAEAVKTADVTINLWLYGSASEPIATAIISKSARVSESFRYDAPTIPGYKLVTDGGADWTIDKYKEIASVVSGIGANTLTFYYKPLFTTVTVYAEEPNNTLITSWTQRIDVDTPTDVEIEPLEYYTAQTTSPTTVTWNGTGTLGSVTYKYKRDTVTPTLIPVDSITGVEITLADVTSMEVRVAEYINLTDSGTAPKGLLTLLDNRVKLALGDDYDGILTLLQADAVVVGTDALSINVFFNVKSSIKDAVAAGYSIISVEGIDDNSRTLYEHVVVAEKGIAIDIEPYDLTPTWTFDGEATSQDYLGFTPTADTYALVFEYVTVTPSSYTIIASASAGGTITNSGVNTVAPNDDITFEFSAESGYHIESVIIDGVIDDSATSPYTFSNVLENHTITVVFVKNDTGGGGWSGGSSSSTTTEKPKNEVKGKLPVNYGTVQADYILTDGLVLLDWSGSKIIEVIAKAQNGYVHFDLSDIKGAASVKLPIGEFASFPLAGNGIIIEFANGTIEISKTAAISLVSQSPGVDIILTVTDGRDKLNNAQKGAITANAVVYDVSVFSGDIQLHEFDGKIRFTAPSGDKAPAKVECVLDTGALELLKSTYDENAKTVTLTITHFSIYALSFDDKPNAAWVNPFIDVNKSDWFYGDVEYVFVNGLMKGTSSDKFSPDLATTRGQIVTVLYRLEGEPAVNGGLPFADVAVGEYYAPAIIWAETNGIVKGYGGGLYGPDDVITREQLVTILYRYANFKKYYTASPIGALDAFSDAEAVSRFAWDASTWAVDTGLLQGSNNKLNPQDNATRAQVAAIMHRFLEFVSE